MTTIKNSLSLIPGGASAGSGSGRRDPVCLVLNRVLKAKLTSTLTVEDACYLTPAYPGDSVLRVETLLAQLRMLSNAGLEARLETEDLPEGIVLADPERFTARFPELAHAVPVLLAHDGVQPYTDGLPRRRPQLTLV